MLSNFQKRTALHSPQNNAHWHQKAKADSNY